jgi:hypothetical protein
MPFLVEDTTFTKGNEAFPLKNKALPGGNEELEAGKAARDQGAQVRASALGATLASTVRYGLWRLIRLGLSLYNLIEAGSKGDGVFMMSAANPLYLGETQTAIAGQGDIN